MNNVQIHLSGIMGERLISITEASEQSGISRNTIGALYHRKVTMVRFDTLVKLCDYLQVPLSELIEYTPNSKEG